MRKILNKQPNQRNDDEEKEWTEMDIIDEDFSV